jgi:hypothetical protein
VKIGLLSLLIFLLSCASDSKKDKEFMASLDKPEESVPAVEVEGDPKILKKFEVEKIDEPAVVLKTVKVAPAPSKKKNKKTKVVEPKPEPIIAVVKPKIDAAIPTSIKKSLPEDYPPELIKINEKAQKVWEVYKPNHFINEKIFLDIHYMGMTVGKIMLTNRGKKNISDKEVWHFHSRFKSAPFYSNIYELDDTVDTYVRTDQFLSVRYSLIQRESSQNVDDLQLHDREKYKTFWFYKRKKKNGDIKNKEEEKPIPYFSIDPFSVVFFYQGLPLKDKDIYEIPIINKGKILILKSEVEGREEINTELGKRNAIRVHATTKYTGETLKSGDLYFWFSDDVRRTLLKAQAKIKIGSVTADIVGLE